MRIITLLFSFSLLICSYCFAGSHEHDEHHHDEHHDDEEKHGTQDAHLHGYAEANVVIDGNSLEFNLDSPSANIVGFEYEASTQSEIDTVKAAEKTLKNTKKMFSFKGTSCQAKKVLVDVSALLDKKTDAAHNTEHDHHDEHHHDEHGDDGEVHSDVEANYQFVCKDGSKLKSIALVLLNSFPAIETLKVDWVKDGKQGSVKLSGKSNEVEFK
ncbi:MAG: hypothetical protein CMK56_07325 [Proteobacteria bacterium]|nr:hypothetical protein [Pseudomonadota bacterium]|tara:strand:- start:786 stop:1424 length:639 start_codon:yes stop_codon:yes gene_type:complete